MDEDDDDFPDDYFDWGEDEDDDEDWYDWDYYDD